MTLPSLALRRAALPLACATLTSFAGASGALASEPEVMAQLEIDPNDPCHFGLRYANGLGGVLLSDDGGRSFRMRCSQSFDADGSFDERFAFGFGADGAPLVGNFPGLALGDAAGCGFALSADPLASLRVTAFAQHPGDHSVSFFATTGQDQRSGVVQRDATGSLSAFGGDDTDASSGLSQFIALSLKLVARSESTGGVRLYESGSARQGDGSMLPAVRYSDDGASSWTTHLVDEAGSANVEIAALDPSNPDGILLVYRDVLGKGSIDEVFVSTDGGATRARFVDDFVAEVSGAVIEPGGKVWLADFGSSSDPASGLWMASSLGDAPQKLHGDKVGCLALRPQDGTLYACSLIGVGPVDPATGAITEMFTFRQTAGFVDCPGEDLATRCEEQLCGNFCDHLHYASAPVCEAYSDPNCGPLAQDVGRDRPAPAHQVDALCPHGDDPGSDGGTTGGDDAGIDAGSPSVDAGGTGNGSTADASLPPSDAGASDGGGCSASGSAGLGWLMLGALGLWRRRRRLS